jgi:hypothetical protein
MESLELVQQTAAVILAAIQPEESVSQEAAELPAAAEPIPEPKRVRRSRNQTTTTEAMAEVA